MLLKRLMIGMFIFALFGAVMLGEVKGDEIFVARDDKVVNSKFGVWLTTDQGVYTTGQPITIVVCVFNRTGKDIVLHFMNAQRFDFAIESVEGKEIWRWSEGRMFAQMLGEEKLGPGREEVTYTARYKGKLEPGIYKITGNVTARERLMLASITVEVK